VNATEAIFLRDFGIRFQFVKQHTYADWSPYSSSRAEFLLSQFSNNARNPTTLADTPEQYYANVDLKHLFTGKNLEGSTVGIAYIGTACAFPARAFGISQALQYDGTIGVFTHELGHNFGASHDSQNQGTIMYPSLGAVPPTRFSQLSLTQIQNHIAANSACFEIDPNAAPPQPETPGNGTPPSGDPNGDDDNEDPSDEEGWEISLRQRRRQVSTRSPIRLAGEVVNADGLPVQDTIINLELSDGTVLAATSTDEDGEFTFTLSPRIFTKRRVTLYASTEDGATQSNPLRISLMKLKQTRRDDSNR
jgi:hypothetical protein